MSYKANSLGASRWASQRPSAKLVGCWLSWATYRLEIRATDRNSGISELAFESFGARTFRRFHSITLQDHSHVVSVNVIFTKSKQFHYITPERPITILAASRVRFVNRRSFPGHEGWWCHWAGLGSSITTTLANPLISLQSYTLCFHFSSFCLG